MKIERAARGGETTVRLIGDLQSEHIGELKKQFLENGPQFVLDLEEVTVVDVDVVRFLGTCELEGMKLVHCSLYVREWIFREQQRNG